MLYFYAKFYIFLAKNADKVGLRWRKRQNRVLFPSKGKKEVAQVLKRELPHKSVKAQARSHARLRRVISFVF